VSEFLPDEAVLSPWGLNGERLADLSVRVDGLSALRAVTLLESELFLGDRLLRDMDSASMAHSLEVRVPLVDTVLSDRLDDLPDPDRYRPLGQKAILRRQSEGRLPRGFFDRKKRGFEFPMDSWLRGPLKSLLEGYILDRNLCSTVGLEPMAVERMWRTFLDRPGALYWTRPWAMFSLLKWSSVNQVRCA
jgi:asparagine synthase (glutamine-hydrolysing)